MCNCSCRSGSPFNVVVIQPGWALLHPICTDELADGEDPEGVVAVGGVPPPCPLLAGPCTGGASEPR